jgi:hypothetical protein
LGVVVADVVPVLVTDVVPVDVGVAVAVVVVVSVVVAVEVTVEVTEVVGLVVGLVRSHSAKLPSTNAVRAEFITPTTALHTSPPPACSLPVNEQLIASS